MAKKIIGYVAVQPLNPETGTSSGRVMDTGVLASSEDEAREVARMAGYRPMRTRPGFTHVPHLGERWVAYVEKQEMYPAPPVPWRRNPSGGRHVSASKSAISFFHQHAGYSRRKGESIKAARMRGARALAKAEAYAHEHGWTIEWHDDPEGWDSIGDVDPKDISEVLYAVLKDENGRVLESVGSVLFGHSSVENRNYGRVVEAELALDAYDRVKMQGPHMTTGWKGRR